MTWTLPNILTVGRLLAAPVVALVFVLLPRPLADWVALLVFIAASVTDWLDGYIARARGLVSRFGTMLDPIADKAMVVIALAVICAVTGAQALIVLPVVVILFREVFVSGLREFLGADSGKLAVTRLAKWKTTVQMLAISALFLSGPLPGVLSVAVVLLWLAAGLTLVTGWDYFRKALPFLEDG